jgi:hypothetical protein
VKSRVHHGGATRRIREHQVQVRLCGAGAYDITTAARNVGRMPCREAVLVVLPYLLDDCATPGGGTPHHLTLRPRDGECLFLIIGSILLGVGVVPERAPSARDRSQGLADGGMVICYLAL